MAAFGLGHFPKDVGNRLLFCDDHSVARAVSIESTCLLSVSQAITHQPWDPQVRGAEGECPGVHGPLQHPVLDSVRADPRHFPCWRDRQVDQHEHHQETRVWALLCWTEGQDRSLPVYSIAATLDVVCVGLVLWARGSVVLTLYRGCHTFTGQISPADLPPSPEPPGASLLCRGNL